MKRPLLTKARKRLAATPAPKPASPPAKGQLGKVERARNLKRVKP